MSTEILEGLIRSLPEEDRASLEKMAQGGGTFRKWGLGKRPALLVVDMTRAFVEDRYPTGWAETGEPCAAAIARLLGQCRKWSVPTIYTVGIVTDHDAEIGAWFQGGDGSKGRFPFTGPEESNEVADAIRPLDSEIVISKAKPSAFFGTQMASLLNYWNVDSLIVTGMVTSGCIRATVVDAFSLNYRVVVPVDAVADRSQISHRVSLIDMGAKYADLTTVDALLSDQEHVAALAGWAEAGAG